MLRLMPRIELNVRILHIKNDSRIWPEVWVLLLTRIVAFLLLLSNVKGVLIFNSELLNIPCIFMYIHIYICIEITREKHDKYMFMMKQETFKDNRVGPKIFFFSKASRS